jgi:hypothetical protein
MRVIAYHSMPPMARDKVPFAASRAASALELS